MNIKSLLLIFFLVICSCERTTRGGSSDLSIQDSSTAQSLDLGTSSDLSVNCNQPGRIIDNNNGMYYDYELKTNCSWSNAPLEGCFRCLPNNVGTLTQDENAKLYSDANCQSAIIEISGPSGVEPYVELYNAAPVFVTNTGQVTTKYYKYSGVARTKSYSYIQGVCYEEGIVDCVTNVSQLEIMDLASK